jgi:putative ABC transport system permease protein
MPPRLAWPFLWYSFRDQPGRTLLSLATVAFGVALGVAVYTINGSAVAQMGRAARQLSGAADLHVTAGAAGFDEALYPQLARHPAVTAASPVVEQHVWLRVAGREPVHVLVLGIDPFRAFAVTPALLGPVAEGKPRAWLQTDAAFLNPAAERLLLRAGDTRFTLPSAKREVAFTQVGRLPEFSSDVAAVVMDIALAQEAFGQVGRLSRIDLVLNPATPAEAMRAELAARLPPGVGVWLPAEGTARVDRLSRAYRINLAVLALVSLFTGGFLVLSSQALVVTRRARELALLGVLGCDQRTRTWLFTLSGLLIGVLGALCGVAMGLLIAQLALAHLPADLGAGVLSFKVREMYVAWPVVALVALLGVMAAAVGAYLPTRALTRRPLAPQLREREQDLPVAALRPAWGMAILALGLCLTPLPPVYGIPWPGYLAIAASLVAVVLLIPALTRTLLRRLPAPRGVVALLARAQVLAQPGVLTANMSAVVVAVALASSMQIMVHSFRASLVHWLGHVLDAPLYLHLVRADDAAGGSPLRALLDRVPGVARIEWMRFDRLYLKPGEPPVALIARDLTPATEAILAARLTPPPEGLRALPRLLVSEAMLDLHGFHPGEVVTLPLGNALGAAPRFYVVGVYRDYARQFGAVVLDRTVYTTLTGDDVSHDAALWLTPGTDVQRVQADLARLAHAPADLEFTRRDEIRERSLAIFDRTFAITHALEASAIVIAIVGVASGFAALAHARRREYGVLLHLGFTRAGIGRMLALEGLQSASVAVLVGLATGMVISLILIHVINRQSFHWGMDLHVPVWTLVGLGGVVLLLAVVAARVAARHALDDQPVRLVRADE